MKAKINVLDLRIVHLEQFGPETGNRFTADDGRHLKAEIRDVEEKCEKHGSMKAHREQEQRNREIDWRLEKLEKPGSDAWQMNGNLIGK